MGHSSKVNPTTLVALEPKNPDADYSPSQAAIDALNHAPTLAQIAWVGITEAGQVCCGWSDGSNVQVAGLAQALSMQALETMKE